MKNVLRSFVRNESGNVAIIATLTLPLVAGAIGAAVAYSSGSNVKSAYQSALDSAILAATVLPLTATVEQRITTAESTFAANIAQFAAKRATTTSSDFSVKAGGSTNFSVTDVPELTVSGTMTANVTNPFGGLIGGSTIPVRVSAAGRKMWTPICLLALNAFDTGAFDMNGNSKLNAPGCAVQVNTSNNKGMTQEGKPTAIAAKFGVSGGHTGTGYSPSPSDGSAPISDPYAKIPFPSHDACDASSKKGLVISESTTLSPGTYCGGIDIKNQASVVLTPGIYVMVDGSFLVSGGGTVSGSQVMIAFTGDDATLRLWGNSSLTLTSPTSGTYANFQFFQDKDDPKGRGAWVSIGGNGNGDDSTKATWDGMAYFPTQNYWQYGNTVVNVNSPDLAIVAGQIWLQGNSTTNVTHNNNRGLAVANKTGMAEGARLVQ